MYDDPRYDAIQHVTVPKAISGTATATASAGVPKATDCARFEFFKKVKVLGMKAVVDTVSTPASVSELLLMNGTNQIGDISIPAASTAGAVIDGTMTAAQATLDANTELQIDLSGTATVSAGVNTVGPLSLSMSYQERFLGS